MMNEVLFRTDDGGMSFVKVADIFNQISDYPSNMEFLSEDIGFMIMIYHANAPVYYQTNDGGLSWMRQSIEVPNIEFAYAQGDSIRRNADGEIEIQIELVSHTEKNQYVTYYTDEGIVWKMKST